MVLYPDIAYNLFQYSIYMRTKFSTNRFSHLEVINTETNKQTNLYLNFII